ncbi:MAG: hypothetical protein HUJ73_04200, partial [Eubacterium sp.]|nr:hypothetical protein [Eubacterium sp.]
MMLFMPVYDMIVLGLFVMAFSLSLFINRVTGRRIFLTAVFLFLFFTLDHIVISLTELDPAFGSGYETMFLMVPSLKTLIYAGSFACMLLLKKHLISEKKETGLGIFLTVIVIIMLFIPALPNSSMKSWIYFLPSQVFLFVFSFVSLRQLKQKSPDHPSKKIPLLRPMLLVMLLFSVIIVIEDSYVIFFRDVYFDAVHIQMRSFSEDIMRIILVVMSVITMTKISRARYTALTQNISSMKDTVSDEAAAQTNSGMSHAAQNGSGETKTLSAQFLSSSAADAVQTAPASGKD